ncbi:MAG: glycosyltransferase family 9 protein [Pseudomonadota bacterium]
MIKLLKIYYLNLRKLVLSFLSKFVKNAELSKIEIKNILVIRLDRLGDLVLTTGIFEMLRKLYPNAKIHALINENLKDVLNNNPYVDETIGINPSLKGLLNLLIQNELKKYKFDLAIDCQANYKLFPAIICFLSKAKIRLGFPIFGKEAFYNLQCTSSTDNKHLIELNRDLVNTVSIDKLETQSPPCIIADPKAFDKIEKKLKDLGINSNDKILCIHPGATHQTQRWFPHRFADLAQRLFKEFDLKPILLVGKNEDMIAQEIIKESKIEIKILNNLKLSEMITLFRRSSLLVCNNSGPLHVAAAIGTKNVSTMGPTIESRFKPIGKNSLYIRKNLSCSPCTLVKCNHHSCMNLIKVENMYEKCVELLNPELTNEDS